MGNYVYRGTPAKRAEGPSPVPSSAAADAFALPELEWEMVKTMSLTDYLHTLGKVSRHRDAMLLKFYMRDFGNAYPPYGELPFAERIRLLYWASAKNKLHVYMLAAWITRFLIFCVKDMVNESLQITGFTDASQRENIDEAVVAALADAFAGHGTPVRTPDSPKMYYKTELLIDHVTARGRYDRMRDPKTIIGLTRRETGGVPYNLGNLIPIRGPGFRGGLQAVPLARTIRIMLGGTKCTPRRLLEWS